jgi:uncharacterized protein YigE (DUF2233 family)
MKRLLLLTLPLALGACEPLPEGEPVVRTELGESVPVDVVEEIVQTAPPEVIAGSACSAATFEDVELTHCVADPEQHRIGTGLAPKSGDNFGTIEAWAAGKNEGAIAFVINGGTFGDDLQPIGYFVSDSDRLVELNRGDGSGNFYLKPNGVFFGSEGNWRILDSDTFLRTVGDRPQFGVQSGPMLLIGGKLHPDMQDDGPSRAIRAGVGIDAKGRAHFVISQEPLSFGKLARFYRDTLEVSDALYLDARSPSLWDPASGRMDGGRVGPLLVVEKN